MSTMENVSLASQAGYNSDHCQLATVGDEDCDQDKLPKAGGPLREGRSVQCEGPGGVVHDV